MPHIKKLPDTAKTPLELFHSYLVDARGDMVEKSKTNLFKGENRLRFFCGDLEDPSRTNADACGYMADDNSFIIHSIRIGIKLSDAALLPDFLRSTRFVLYIADKPYGLVEANMLAEPDTLLMVPRQPDPTEPTEFQVDAWAEKPLERQVHIPPRQGFLVQMETSMLFANQVQRIEDGIKKEFIEIRVTLCGTKITHNSVEIEELLEAFETESDEGQRRPGSSSCDKAPGNPATNQDDFLLDLLCGKLTFHLNMIAGGKAEFTDEQVKACLTTVMATLPTYYNANGEFVIHPAARTKPSTEFSQIDTETGESKKWDPTEYLKTQKKKS